METKEEKVWKHLINRSIELKQGALARNSKKRRIYAPHFEVGQGLEHYVVKISVTGAPWEWVKGSPSTAASASQAVGSIPL